MRTGNAIAALLRKDLLLEARRQYGFFGILLYVGATIFVLYLSMGQPEAAVWNGLFWMMQLFIGINAVAKSFLQESAGRQLYFYSIARPASFILARLIYNAALMGLMTLLSILLFRLLLGSPLAHAGRFAAIALFGGVSISLVFTFLAAIAARAQQNAALMAILGFPIIIPQLMLLMRIANGAFSDVVQGGLGAMYALLAAFDVMVIVLAVILFPFLWRD